MRTEPAHLLPQPQRNPLSHQKICHSTPPPREPAHLYPNPWHSRPRLWCPHPSSAQVQGAALQDPKAQTISRPQNRCAIRSSRQRPYTAVRARTARSRPRPPQSFFLPQPQTPRTVQVSHSNEDDPMCVLVADKLADEGNEKETQMMCHYLPPRVISWPPGPTRAAVKQAVRSVYQWRF